jgi:hypothetical protein
MKLLTIMAVISVSIWFGLGVMAARSYYHAHPVERIVIYAQTDRRDMQVFLELDGTPDAVEGAAFKVFCSTQQHPNWIKKQVDEYRSAYRDLLTAYVVEAYSDVDPVEGCGYGPDIRAMIIEERARAAAAIQAQEDTVDRLGLDHDGNLTSAHWQ